VPRVKNQERSNYAQARRGVQWAIGPIIIIALVPNHSATKRHGRRNKRRCCRAYAHRLPCHMRLPMPNEFYGTIALAPPDTIYERIRRTQTLGPYVLYHAMTIVEEKNHSVQSIYMCPMTNEYRKQYIWRTKKLKTK